MTETSSSSRACTSRLSPTTTAFGRRHHTTIVIKSQVCYIVGFQNIQIKKEEHAQQQVIERANAARARTYVSQELALNEGARRVDLASLKYN